MLNRNIHKYLSGEAFSNGFMLPFKCHSSKIMYRDEALVELAKGKKVLHVGFVDHLPVLDEKIKNNRWLHNKLVDVCELCVGVDINEDGVNYLKREYQYENIFSLDITKDDLPEVVLSERFDYIFLPDVIEHIGNPSLFLFNLRERLSGRTDVCVLTTPNAFRLNNFINTIKGKEVINSDHRFWFTPYTISKILTDAGYDNLEVNFSEHGYLPRRKIFKKMILKTKPSLRDTLIVFCAFKSIK